MAGMFGIYTDEHISPAIIKGLRKLGVDVMTFREAGLVSADDELHLEKAHAEGLVMLTMDSDFIGMHSSGKAHSGIIFIPARRTIGQIIKGVVRIRQAISAEEMRGKLQYLQV